MNMLTSFAVQFAIIAAITLLERQWHKGPTDWVRNLQSWVINFGTALAFMPLVRDWHGASLIDGNALPVYIAFPLFLVVRDGLEFAFHLAQHRVGILWKMHSLHHSDPEMNALTTNRHFWGDQFIKAMTIWPLTIAIVAPSTTVVLFYAVACLYNYFIHANLKVDFGKWSWVLNCPAYHRRHHSKLHEHYDSNFAAMLPIFDVLCGTYHRADGWPPTGQDTAPGGIAELVSWPLHNQEAVAEPA